MRALRDDPHVAAELLAAVLRGRLHRLSTGVKAAAIAGQADLDRMQEVVDLRGGQVAIERAAERVDRAVGAGEEAERGLAGLEGGLEAHVAAGGHARVAAGRVEALTAHEADAR